MALYKALMEDSSLQGNMVPGSAPDVLDEYPSNSEGYTNSLLTRKSSETARDKKHSESSTTAVLSKLPYTVLNPSRDSGNKTCGTTSSLSTDPYHSSGTSSSLAPEDVLTEIKTEHVCETRFTKKSSPQHPSSEDNPGLTCVRSDNLGEHGDNSGQVSSDDGSIRVDRNQPGPVTAHNLDQCVSCYNCQIHRVGSDIDNRVEPSMYNDDDRLNNSCLYENKNPRPYKYSNWKTDETDRTFGDEQTKKNNECCKESICNDEMSPNIKQTFDQVLMDEGQACGNSLYFSNQVVGTDKTNPLSDHVTADLIISKSGQSFGDDSDTTNQEDDQKDRILAINEQDKIKNERRFPDTADLHIQNMDASQTESLLTKIVPDSTVNTETNTVLAEAMARRDAMVKDLSVDGSGLKVMCCLLGVIVVFAIAIITIVVTGL